MAITTKRLARVFVHGATEYPDPSPISKPDQCLQMLALTNAALNNAALDGPTYEGGKEVYRVKVSAGTKG